MCINILTNYFLGNLVPNRAGKISIFPQFTSPQFFLYFGILLKYFTRADTLEYANNFSYRIFWRKRQKYMNMIFRYFHRIYLKLKILRNLFKQLLYSLPNLSSQYPFPIFRCPNKMIRAIIYCVTRSSYRHRPYLHLKNISRGGWSHMISYMVNHSSPPTGRGILVCLS
jgi:hypothetical protein